MAEKFGLVLRVVCNAVARAAFIIRLGGDRCWAKNSTSRQRHFRLARSRCTLFASATERDGRRGGCNDEDSSAIICLHWRRRCALSRRRMRARKPTIRTTPIHFIVGFAAGGGNDLFARLVVKSSRRIPAPPR